MRLTTGRSETGRHRIALSRDEGRSAFAVVYFNDSDTVDDIVDQLQFLIRSAREATTESTE